MPARSAGDAADVGAGLTGGLAAAPDHVFDLRGIEARDLGEHARR